MNKVLNCYTLEDVIEVTKTLPSITNDTDRLLTFLSYGYNISHFELERVLELYGISYDDIVRYKEVDNVLVINSTPLSKLFNLIRLRFDFEYIFEIEEDLSEKVSTLYSIDKVREWCKKFIGILAFTKDKYKTILDIYDNNIAKLMDGLKTSTEASHEIHRDEDYDTDVSGKNLLNDTPQTTDVVATIEGNQYVSELSKSEAHTDNTGDVDETGSREEETTIDTKYTIEKIKEIQDSYEQVLKRWSEEFSPLFKEEA